MTANPRLCQITQIIMEGRATALEGPEFDSWSIQIDKNLGQVKRDSEGNQCFTDAQNERIIHNARSAVQWFQRQPMSRRLHRLTASGYLTRRVRLYLRHRSKWPTQMGPAPKGGTEHALLELWEDSIAHKAGKLPAAIDHYTAWCDRHETHRMTAEYRQVRQLVRDNAEKLQSKLQSLPLISIQTERLKSYVHGTRGWPKFMSLPKPTSQLETDVIKDWYGDNRSKLSPTWSPGITEQHRRDARILWHSLNAHGQAINTPTPSSDRRSQQRKRQKRKQQLIAQSNQRRPYGQSTPPRKQ